jgi:glycosyltransferase involved in cell wall biosynthesis
MQPRRPLRFLHLTTFYPPYAFGGDAIYVHRLAHALADAGHEVDVAHCRDSYHLLHPGEPEIPFPEHPRVTRHELRSGLGWLSPLLTQQTGRPLLKRAALAALLAGKRYDVVHFHNVSLLGATLPSMETPWRETLKVYTTHEYWLVCPTHLLWKYDRRPCERAQCLPCTVHARRPPQLWRSTRLLERSARDVDLFLAPSSFAARMHRARGFAPPMAELPYFADRCDDDWRSPAPRPHERPYFLFVGRLEKLKGVHTLVEAWRKLDGADLLVAGTGSQTAALRAQAAGNPRVRLLGALPPDELGPFYAHAIACVVPSLAYETFAMVIIESLSRKTPVIVHGIGPPPEIVAQSGGGLIYRSETQLLDALDRLRGSPQLRAELGESGYRTYAERWTREAHLEQYLGHLRATATKKLGYVPWEDGRRDEGRGAREEGQG